MNDIAVINNNSTIEQLLLKNRPILAQALPSFMNMDRFVRSCLMSIARNPDLQKCSSVSLFTSIQQSAQLGLEVGLQNQAHLVPRWNGENKCFEATFQIGYMGLTMLAERNGDIVDSDANLVYEKDEFDYCLGDSPYIKHKPSHEQDRGSLCFFYCWATPKNGKIKVSVMSKYEMKQHVEYFVSKKKDGSTSSVWINHFDSMGLKTVKIKCFKQLARSPELREAIALDEIADCGEDQGLVNMYHNKQVSDARESNANAVLESLKSLARDDSDENKKIIPASAMYSKMESSKTVKDACDTMNEFMDGSYTTEERKIMTSTFNAVRKRLHQQSQVKK